MTTDQFTDVCNRAFNELMAWDSVVPLRKLLCAHGIDEDTARIIFGFGFGAGSKCAIDEMRLGFKAALAEAP